MTEWSSIADVGQFRVRSQRYAVARRVDRPTVVLGSTQGEAVLDPSAVRAWNGEVVRRRGGGGAVLLLPGDHLWIDAWIPRDDPLWNDDVSEAALWVGEWWRGALGFRGPDGLEVHRGRMITGPYQAVCFSGRGPGEVFHREAKVVGLSQWRSREGALFHTCAYTHWDPAPLIDLLDLSEGARAEWRRELAGTAVGIEDLEPSSTATAIVTATATATASVAESLLSTFPDWR